MINICLDLVPYDFVEQDNPNTLVMKSQHFAEKLEVKSRFTERYQGFQYEDDHGNQTFIYIDADVDDDTVTFFANVPITEDMLVQFFKVNEYAIDEIGYECLERNKDY